VRPIREVAQDLGIDPAHLIPYGDDKAKVRAAARQSGRPPGRLVLVSAITPTRAGEGKTTTSIALAQGLARIGKRCCAVLREPSLGPVFGLKGGATGGGRSVLHPAVDINLHFTGDFHAISAANNLLAALLDNHLHFGNRLSIDVRRVLWRRVMDLNDRALRQVIVGLGGPERGVPRETGFDITPASEVMAVLCLAEDEDDLRARLSRLIVALTPDELPVTAADLKAVGSMMAVLKDAMLPNLVQTAEGVPVLVHGGPFANIAHGCNSVAATKTALAHTDWVVTEAGFGFDLGAEKFLDIKCVEAGLAPAGAVVVATVRALKLHGGAAYEALKDPDPAAVERGLPNLAKHLETARLFGLTPVVALNRFGDDRDDEVAVVRRACAGWGLPFAVSDGFAHGGEGSTELAETVVDHVTRHPAPPLRPLYERTDPLPVKLDKVARGAYGAAGVTYTAEAERKLAQIEKLGYEHLPICVAKTPASLSDDPGKVGRPEGFTITVRDTVLSAGAGFVVPLCGDILRMPGLPARPQSDHIDLVGGEVVGLR
jgi:formate--tetrahydrofolate ligase